MRSVPKLHWYMSGCHLHKREVYQVVLTYVCVMTCVSKNKWGLWHFVSSVGFKSFVFFFVRDQAPRYCCGLLKPLPKVTSFDVIMPDNWNERNLFLNMWCKAFRLFAMCLYDLVVAGYVFCPLSFVLIFWYKKGRWYNHSTCLDGSIMLVHSGYNKGRWYNHSTSPGGLIILDHSGYNKGRWYNHFTSLTLPPGGPIIMYHSGYNKGRWSNHFNSPGRIFLDQWRPFDVSTQTLVGTASNPKSVQCGHKACSWRGKIKVFD